MPVFLKLKVYKAQQSFGAEAQGAKKANEKAPTPTWALGLPSRGMPNATSFVHLAFRLDTLFEALPKSICYFSLAVDVMFNYKKSIGDHSTHLFST